MASRLYSKFRQLLPIMYNEQEFLEYLGIQLEKLKNSLFLNQTQEFIAHILQEFMGALKHNADKIQLNSEQYFKNPRYYEQYFDMWVNVGASAGVMPNVPLMGVDPAQCSQFFKIFCDSSDVINRKFES